MVSTKAVDNTVQAIETRLNTFSGDMVRIEYLENCLRQIPIANDVQRFCHLKLADLYAYKLMWATAAKHMDAAAECATTYKDKISYFMKEVTLLIKAGDYVLIDKPYKKSMAAGTNSEKQAIQNFLKNQLMEQAKDFEKRNKRSNAAQIYERMLELAGLFNTEEERKEIIKKLGELNSKLGRIKDAQRYEQQLKKPIQMPRDPESNVRKISWADLGIERY